ncbi:MAG TPA: sigma-70 family RNA polymerase sigma factor [Verrucomicrobiae bacterium]|nr:sigma-70 family RNA polymerase sigma factor [Verrucomicrobiae bacterium]
MATNATFTSLSAAVLIRYALMSGEPPPLASDIAALTAQMARGEEEAFRAFQSAYFHRLLRYLFVMTRGDEEAARETLQLTLLRVARHVRRFDSEAAFWSWLTVLARSSVVDEARKRNRQASLLHRFFQWQQVDNQPTDHEAKGRLLALLELSVNDLSVEDRALVERKYFEGESVREIAARLSATEQAVESRLVRVRRHLKELLTARLKHEAS